MIDFNIKKALEKCRVKDRFKFQKRFQTLSQQKNIEQEALEKLLLDIQESQSKVTNKQELIPDIEYPDLPVSNRREEIQKLIQDNQVVIIAGETGSGKTTQIPKMCLELGRGTTGYIGHTQPRRLAARSVADRIADELNTQLGEKVGYKVRFNDQVGDNSYIKLMTDGILLAEIQQDRFLNAYDTIIIDEAHERSLNIDFLIGYLKRLLPKRPDLKVIITSATIDPERFAKHFNNAPIIEVSGRTYPVEIRYHDPVEEDDNDQQSMIIKAVDELMREPLGDILIFLSGERDIRDTEDALRKRQYRNTQILPLYARLSSAEQQRIFAPHNQRHIILSTNVAETSLTVPGIKYVIDTGEARISRYSARSKIQRLPIEAISQASANQRSGRCGRQSNGIAIRLYSEDDFNARPAFTDPEILRTHLSSVILQMLSLGLGEIERFPFVQPPDQRQINDGIKLLEELNAVAHKGRQLQLTAIGQRMAKLPLDPRYARMLIESEKYDAVSEIAIIAAGLSVQDPRERPTDKQQKADLAHAQFVDKDSDLSSLQNLWLGFKEQQKTTSNNQVRKWCKQNFIHYQRMREWQDIVSQIKQTLVAVNLRLNQQPADYEAVHRSVAVGLLSQIGMKDKNKQYLGCRNTNFMIFPGSGVFKQQPKWLMATELVETSKLYARQVAKIDVAWLESISEHLSKKSYSEPHWSKDAGATKAYLTVTLLGLPIVNRRLVEYSKIDPVISRELMIREGLVYGHTKLKYAFLTHNQAQIEAVELLEKKARRRDILVDEETLCQFYDNIIPHDVVNEATFKKWWRIKSQKSPELLHFSYESLLKKSAEEITEGAYPNVWHQDGLTLKLSYHFEPNEAIDGVCLHVPVTILNQVKDVGFDWLVPGMRHELIVQYIKTLPKALRRSFVPAPNFADACAGEISPKDKNGQDVALVDALALKLFRMTGTKVTGEDFDSTQLPSHLRFNFAAIDEKGKILGSAKSLVELKKQFQHKLKHTLEKVAATDNIEQSSLTDWSIKDIPAVYKRKQAGFEITGYPALKVNNKSVDLVLFDSERAAQESHKEGVLHLIKNNIPSPVKFLQQKLPNKTKLSLYYTPFGHVSVLIDDIILAALYLLCEEIQPLDQARTKQVYEQMREHCRMHLNDKALEVATGIEDGLSTAHKIQSLCKGNIPLNLINSIAHIKDNVEKLVYKGFVLDFCQGRLNDWNRYLQALKQRAEKLKVDPSRDRLNQLEVDKAESAILDKEKALSKVSASNVILHEAREMLEEYKVSLFAQQLGTKFPISLKRIKNKLEEY
ncbi:ATP-dependent RNA helicase HrpA [Glaciecola sp. 1036]|uniref:ATP-dependent RNA helicase HrpA n=1 Tax=Alteromonadaceae TaxID=72275 RepID=UPI003D00FD01